MLATCLGYSGPESSDRGLVLPVNETAQQAAVETWDLVLRFLLTDRLAHWDEMECSDL